MINAIISANHEKEEAAGFLRNSAFSDFCAFRPALLAVGGCLARKVILE